MDNNENKSFNYTYSASQQSEVRRIRDKYVAKEADKMEQLRKLDRRVSQKATMYAIIIGIIGALVMGSGMSCVMVWQGVMFVPGIVIGIIGMADMCIAYPLYCRILEKERQKIAPEIIRLTDELMK